MKLLFDENLSHRLVDLLAAEFPHSAHPRRLGMLGASDLVLWEYARQHGFTIVSKDNDFRQRVFLHGPPPKVIWLSIGNAGTRAIVALLRKHVHTIEAFTTSSEEGLLVIEDF
jgi:predicted nuclease of predicted toxin-antitoxin system